MCVFVCFFFDRSGDHRDLHVLSHSFPTRLFSDLFRVRFGDVELVSKLVEGKFPDFTRVIPTTYTRHFSIDRETLQGSLQRAAILTTDKLKGVRVQLAENLLKITSSNTEQEEAQEEVEIDYSHEQLDVGFRSEERRGGTEWVSTCRSRWAQSH